MKAYEVYHGKVEKGIPVTFKNKPNPHIIIWDKVRDGLCPIKIAVEEWDEKNLSAKIENVEVQKSENYIMKPSLDLTTNDILVFWNLTSPEGGDVELFVKNADISIIGGASYTYDGMRIAGFLVILKKGQYLNARVWGRSGKKTNWKLRWNGHDIKVSLGILRDFSDSSFDFLEKFFERAFGW